MSDPIENIHQNDRQAWLRLFALTETSQLRAVWEGLPNPPETRFLRAPEIGLAMVRGRAGGKGNAFNLGEMSVTRCVVSGIDRGTGARLDGVGVVQGRDKDKAELVARLDIAMQDTTLTQEARDTLLATIRTAREIETSAKLAKTAATKVEFFTMERGR